MNKAIKKQWVKALMSGKYPQDTGVLKSYAGYCCLGVLRECINPGDVSHMAGADLLSLEQLKKFSLDHEIQQSLADANDEGVPFEMIAGLIDHAL